MPAHTPKFEKKEHLFYLQFIWRFLILQNFQLYPTSHQVPENTSEIKQALIIYPESFALERLPDFRKGLETIFSLRQYLQQHFKKNISFEWNYLGQNQERLKYLSYLEQFFWQHQDNEHVVQDPEYQKLVEKPWLILTKLDVLEQMPESATEHFSQKTLDFIQTLSVSMHNWELNPYLLVNNLGSFQWQIIIFDLIQVNGCIFNQDNLLWQKIELEYLT
jgi:hypothetical protein